MSFIYLRYHNPELATSGSTYFQELTGALAVAGAAVYEPSRVADRMVGLAGAEFVIGSPDASSAVFPPIQSFRSDQLPK